MSLKDNRVHSSFVGLPPSPGSLCGLDQMTNYLVLVWYLILVIKYSSFKDCEHMRSCLPFVPNFNPGSIVYYTWKKSMSFITSVLIFFTHGVILLTPHVYTMPELGPMNGSTPYVGWFHVFCHQKNLNIITALAIYM